MCVWVEDADKLEINSKELEIVFHNKKVNTFLQSNSTLGLAGIKGQGKTFLIKVKRKNLSSNNNSVLCFPQNNMVDVIDSSSINIDRSLTKLLMDYNIWVSLWKYSICGTILKHPKFNKMYKINKLNISTESKELLKLKNVNCSATYLLRKILNSNFSTVQKIIEDVGELLEIIKEIHQCIYMFFDKMDQGFSLYAKNFNKDSKLPKRSRNASFWQYAQYSLAEASYDIFTNTSHHIKILYTIRQEALIDCELLNKDKTRNINAYIVKLEYSKNDLKEMFNTYIKHEDDKNLTKASLKMDDPSIAFFGYEQVNHGYIPFLKENVFDYLYRHSFKRPYDIMKICRALYLSNDFNIKNVRHIVNNESNNILNSYLQELEIFLPCDIEEIVRLVKMIPGNILNLDLMKSICETYNFENITYNTWQCNQDCRRCNCMQPFSILYNIGLIGYLCKHEADVYPYEEFKNIGKSVLELNSHALPSSEYYFLHPALSNKARDLRNEVGLTFEMNKIMLIGDGCYMKNQQKNEVKKYVKTIFNVFLKERIFISSTIEDLKEERNKIRECIKERGLHPIMSEHNEFNLNESQKIHSHDYCLDELLKCKSCIFIIGINYGGTYSGSKYKKERDEIKNLSEEKIPNPSISLMEYYIARKHHLKCYAFMHKKMDDKKTNEKLSDEIKNMLKFLNHFTTDGKNIKGNWVTRYSSLTELISLINNLKFI